MQNLLIALLSLPYRILSQFEWTVAFFPVHSQFINKWVSSLCFSCPPLHSLLIAIQVSICLSTHFHVCFSFPLLPHKIQTSQRRFHPSVTSIDVKEVHTHTASSLPSITPRTYGLTCLLDRQGKHVWLIVRQLPIKAGRGNALVMLQDRAKAIFWKKAKNTGTFAALLQK